MRTRRGDTTIRCALRPSLLVGGVATRNTTLILYCVRLLVSLRYGGPAEL